MDLRLFLGAGLLAALALFALPAAAQVAPPEESPAPEASPASPSPPPPDTAVQAEPVPDPATPAPEEEGSREKDGKPDQPASQPLPPGR